MYKGKLTRLRRLEPQDASIILPKWNNYELRQYLPSPLPNNHDEMIKFIEAANEDFAQRKGFTFGIETLDTETLVGLISLESVSWISRNASVGILGIFDPEVRGKGCGTDAMLVLLDVAFSVLDLYSVYLWVEDFNERAIHLYQKIGFSVQGRLRELAFRNGERCDVVIMDILKPEFVEKHGILPKGNDT